MSRQIFAVPSLIHGLDNFKKGLSGIIKFYCDALAPKKTPTSNFFSLALYLLNTLFVVNFFIYQYTGQGIINFPMELMNRGSAETLVDFDYLLEISTLFIFASIFLVALKITFSGISYRLLMEYPALIALYITITSPINLDNGISGLWAVVLIGYCLIRIIQLSGSTQSKDW